MISRGVDIFLHNPDRTVPKDGGQSREINPGLGHFGSESMSEIVENEMEFASSLIPCTCRVVGSVHTHDVFAGFPI